MQQEKEGIRGFGSREEKSQQQTDDSSGCAAVNRVETGTRDQGVGTREELTSGLWLVASEKPRAMTADSEHVLCIAFYVKDEKRKKVRRDFDKLHDLC
jgi:hypothetical protein